MAYKDADELMLAVLGILNEAYDYTSPGRLWHGGEVASRGCTR